jgi:hypothetical protein
MTTEHDDQEPERREDSRSTFRRLRALKASLPGRVNKHDKAIVLIAACIEEGINTRGRIGIVLEHIGMDRSHVMIILNEGTGNDPNRHRWNRDENGTYALLAE